MKGGTLTIMEIVQVSRTDGTTTSYIVEKDDSGDGTLILRRDTSAEDIMRREGGRPMTDAEFEQHFGDLPTGPA